MAERRLFCLLRGLERWILMIVQKDRRSDRTTPPKLKGRLKRCDVRAKRSLSSDVGRSLDALMLYGIYDRLADIGPFSSPLPCLRVKPRTFRRWLGKDRHSPSPCPQALAGACETASRQSRARAARKQQVCSVEAVGDPERPAQQNPAQRALRGDGSTFHGCEGPPERAEIRLRRPWKAGCVSLAITFSRNRATTNYRLITYYNSASYQGLLSFMARMTSGWRGMSTRPNDGPTHATQSFLKGRGGGWSRRRKIPPLPTL